MKLTVITLISLFLVFSQNNKSLAQDEKFIRQVLSKNHQDQVLSPEKEKKYRWMVNSGAINIDLDNDGFYEKIYESKKDGEDWFNILDSNGKKIFEKKLQAKGYKSTLYKVHLVSLSKAHKALILYYYQGHSSFINFHGSAQLYFVTWDNNNLQTLSMDTGPSYFDEVELPGKHYHNRQFKVNVFDYNDDGIKEVSVHFSKISRVYFYLGSGHWSQI